MDVSVLDGAPIARNQRPSLCRWVWYAAAVAACDAPWWRYNACLKRTILTAATVAAFAGVTATALGARPATAHERSSMARAVRQYWHPYAKCRSTKQRVSTVESGWASAWLGGHCGDTVIFHHNGQDRPGIWSVKLVYGEGEGPCEDVPTRVVVDLGLTENMAECARTWHEAREKEQYEAEQHRQKAEAKDREELEIAENNCAEQGPGDKLVLFNEEGEPIRGPNGSFECQTLGGLVWVSGK